MNPAEELALRKCPKATGATGRRWREPQIAFALKQRGVLVTGEPGVGRTWFARCVAELSGAEVHWAVATETSRSIPFGAFAGLLHDVTELHPVAVLNVLRRRLGPRSLLVVDDAHLLDEASATTLLALAAGGARLLVTARPGGPDAVLALAKDGFLDELLLKPFSREATAGALAEGLDGEVAPGTADLLWRWSRGNGRDITELVQHGLMHGRLTRTGGVWVWRGDTDVPPIAVQPITGLSSAGVEALCALVLGEPVAVDVLVRVASAEGFAEIEERGLVDGAAGSVRLARPMIAAAAAPHLTPSRRRRLVDRLLALGAGSARLLLDSGVTDPARFTAAARDVLLEQPKLAVQLASRAVSLDPGPHAALVLADAHAECGSVDSAWEAHRLAGQRVRDDDDRLAVVLVQASLTIWCDRKPSVAVELLENSSLPERFHSDLESAVAVALLFSARPADALIRAEKVLAGEPTRTAWGRAMLVSAAALVMADRPREAAEAMDRLTSSADVSPFYRGLARSVTRLLGPDHPSPGLALLREAHLRESTGRGVFRSEMTANLVVAEAAAGLRNDAQPDGVAILPALATWMSAAAGRSASLYLAAAREAADAGSLRCMVFYLAGAAEHGAAAEAVHVLGDRSFAAPDTRARAIGICARASRSDTDLLVAAEAHRDAGMLPEALKFAEAAGGVAAVALAHELRGVLGLPAPKVPDGLTRRELEVVRHAASGMTDRAIAETLVLSVRTVESHLAAAYRKLAINSRQELASYFAS
ncbi:LuxR C-terminal-related transcriptional regulator [Lentzea sp. NPDC006480]|uniref:helix-turn-helix transcriptional regulator n=1 Tax=Lentzea sp. NPDC006480 TaxID=3157176 RepID=UPI0033AC7425